MTTWVSVHAFYAGDLDVLLLDGVRPAMQRLRGVRGDTTWHYLRYWNGGPHLRVRVQCAETDAEDVAASLCRALADFLRSRPAGPLDPGAYRHRAEGMSRVLTAAAAGTAPAEEVEPLQPGDTVQLRPYEYEEQRYGGAWARELTEAHFRRSSELATTVVAHSRGRRAARRALALALLTEFVAALDMTPDDVRETFAAYRDTLSAAGGPVPEPLGLDVDETDRLDEQGPRALGPVARDLWRREIGLCAAILRDLWTAARLTCPPRPILLSYAHMLHNRLGIGLVEEAHLCRITAHGADQQRREESLHGDH